MAPFLGRHNLSNILIHLINYFEERITIKIVSSPASFTTLKMKVSIKDFFINFVTFTEETFMFCAVINEWDQLDLEILHCNSYRVFCSALLKFVASVENNILNKVSHLGETKLRHCFQNTENLVSARGIDNYIIISLCII